jgi:exodeoxyribonuclease-3
MRIATWNVNSLKARLDKVAWWIDRARPDVLLLQETKLADDSAPYSTFDKLGYSLAHHGSGGRNGVAIASLSKITDLEAHFGDAIGEGFGTVDEPLREPRFLAGTCGGIRVATVYVPNGRALDSPSYTAKLSWLERLAQWVRAQSEGRPLAVGGDFNVAPTDLDVWDPKACHGGTHVSPPERAAFVRLEALGLVDAYRKHHTEGDRYTWWDYRAGDFHRNVGMRIDHLLVSPTLASRTVGAEIDRVARKGKPLPSDHAPLVVDIDEPGRTFDAGWSSADERIAERRARKPRG